VTERSWFVHAVVWSRHARDCVWPKNEGALKFREGVAGLAGPVSGKTSLLILKAFSLKRPMDAALLEGGGIILGFKTPFTLYFSLFSANSNWGDRFDHDCFRHQAVRGLRRVPDGA